MLALVNRPAFCAKRPYVAPGDGLNVNRVFLGRADGSLAERFARAVMAVATSAQHWVDLHSRNLHEALWPLVIYSRDGPPPVAQTVRRMAQAYGIPVPVESSALAGDTYQTPPAPALPPSSRRAASWPAGARQRRPAGRGALKRVPRAGYDPRVGSGFRHHHLHPKSLGALSAQSATASPDPRGPSGPGWGGRRHSD